LLAISDLLQDAATSRSVNRKISSVYESVLFTAEAQRTQRLRREFEISNLEFEIAFLCATSALSAFLR
jgi:hypothetical protein